MWNKSFPVVWFRNESRVMNTLLTNSTCPGNILKKVGQTMCAADMACLEGPHSTRLKYFFWPSMNNLPLNVLENLLFKLSQHHHVYRQVHICYEWTHNINGTSLGEHIYSREEYFLVTCCLLAHRQGIVSWKNLKKFSRKATETGQKWKSYGNCTNFMEKSWKQSQYLWKTCMISVYIPKKITGFQSDDNIFWYI